MMEYYQELFNHMSNEHGLILLQSEMDDIINICDKMLNNSSGSNETRAISKNEGKKEVCQHRWNEIYDFTFQCGKCGEIDGTL